MSSRLASVCCGMIAIVIAMLLAAYQAPVLAHNHASHTSHTDARSSDLSANASGAHEPRLRAVMQVDCHGPNSLDRSERPQGDGHCPPCYIAAPEAVALGVPARDSEKPAFKAASTYLALVSITAGQPPRDDFRPVGASSVPAAHPDILLATLRLRL